MQPGNTKRITGGQAEQWAAPSVASNKMPQPSEPQTPTETAANDEPDSACTIHITIAEQPTTQTPTLSPPDTAWLNETLNKAAQHLGISGELSVVIVRDQAMAQLHQQFSGIPGTTDVLTFNLNESQQAPGSTPAAIEGEIYICLDEAHRRAADFNHTADHELLLYAIHGIHHLLGHDDHNESDYQRMHQAEDKLLTALGVGPIFHASPANPTGDTSDG